MKISISDYQFKLVIERKNNKNLYLSLSDDTLTVRCPKSLSDKQIEAFILAKSEWILKANNRLKNRLSTVDDNLSYLGENYHLNFVSGHNDFKIKDFEITLYGKDLESALNNFYIKNEKTLSELIDGFKDKYYRILKDYYYTSEPEIRFRSLKRAWGVCYPKKNLIVINHKLIHYPKCCLEAVFWHECLHFILPNHSKRFHELLLYHMPDYKKFSNILK